MEENIKKIKMLFNEIKNKELNKSLRKGTTGIGYTFESLIGKKEDSNFLPDYKGIEIKTKLGYSKSPLTLFCLTPTKNNDSCIPYLLNRFGYPDKKSDFKNFRGNVYYKYNNIIANRYIFKLKICENEKILKLIIKNLNLETIDDSIYWDLDIIKNRLFTKLSYLAYIKGYPYKKDNNTYYKYTSLEIYKIKDFNVFLKLLKEDKIFITFNIGVYLTKEKYGHINDRGTAFRIATTSINSLFEKID